jgi:hypothetical protein
MSYLFTHSLRLPAQGSVWARMVIAEADPELRSLYATGFRAEALDVIEHHQMRDIAQIVEHNNAHALVFNPALASHKAVISEIEAVRKVAPATAIVTVGEQVTEMLQRELMRLGVLAHIERQFSRPQDVLVVVIQTMQQNLLNS